MRTARCVVRRAASEGDIRSSIYVPFDDLGGLIGDFCCSRMTPAARIWRRGERVAARGGFGHRDVMELPIDSCDSSNTRKCRT